MGRMVKRLSSLEIDEVSLVDRPANQHGLVAIAKRQEDTVGIFDAQGNEVDEDQLEHGDVVYDDAGNEFVFVEGDDEGADDGSPADEYEYEDAEVGKALSRSKIKAAGRLGRMKAKDAYGSAKGAAGRGAGYVNSHRAGFAVAGAGAGGAGAGYGAGRFRKSLGDQVLVELSKAVTEDDRDAIIAKALNSVDEISKRNDDLEDLVYDLLEAREAEGFTELAKSYELPVDPADIGGLMQRAAAYLPQEDVVALDRIFSSYGEVAKAAFDEVGYNGYDEPDVLSQVYAVAGEAVSKSGAAMSQEQAVTALFEANPAAYDEYEREQRRN